MFPEIFKKFEIGFCAIDQQQTIPNKHKVTNVRLIINSYLFVDAKIRKENTRNKGKSLFVSRDFPILFYHTH